MNLKLTDLKQIWRMMLPVALLALLLGTTLGGVWHHHANAPADTCPICHLNHQVLESTPAGVRVSIPVAEESKPEVQFQCFLPGPAALRIPVRGPPA